MHGSLCLGEFVETPGPSALTRYEVDKPVKLVFTGKGSRQSMASGRYGLSLVGVGEIVVQLLLEILLL